MHRGGRGRRDRTSHLHSAMRLGTCRVRCRRPAQSTGPTISWQGRLKRNEKKRTSAGAAGCLSGVASATGCSKLRARDQLNKGVQSYKNAKYEEAIEHFQQAVRTRSQPAERAPLSGDRVMPSNTFPARMLADNNAWPSRPSTNTRRCWSAIPEEHQQRQGHRLPVPANEEVGAGEGVLPQGD